jgi:hypothetical protein
MKGSRLVDNPYSRSDVRIVNGRRSGRNPQQQYDLIPVVTAVRIDSLQCNLLLPLDKTSPSLSHPETKNVVLLEHGELLTVGRIHGTQVTDLTLYILEIDFELFHDSQSANSMEQNPYSEDDGHSAVQEIPRLLWNQINAVHTCKRYFLRFILILSSRLRIGLPYDLFPLDFPK